MMGSRRSVSYAAAAVSDADGIKTSFATDTDPVTLTEADFNGAAVAAASGVLDLPRTVSITLSNNADQFSVDPIVLTGLRGGQTVTESLTPANNDGNVTLYGNQPFDRLVSVALPAMGGTGGTITIGVQDICAPHGDTFAAVEAAATGTLYVGYGGPDTAPAQVDGIPIGTAQVGFPKPIRPTRVRTRTSASLTTVGVTVYL